MVPVKAFFDATAVAAAGAEDGGAVPAVHVQVVTLAAPWADQAVGVQPGDELGVAGVLVHQFGEREVHGCLSAEGRMNLPPSQLREPVRSRASTDFPT